MKKNYLLALLLCLSFSFITKAQIHPRQTESFNAIHASSNGSNWTYSTLDQLTNRTETPYNS